jgi:uncharacterized protein (DUF433 family)
MGEGSSLWRFLLLILEEILGDFPELVREVILACLAYAGDREHKIAISA